MILKDIIMKLIYENKIIHISEIDRLTRKHLPGVSKIERIKKINSVLNELTDVKIENSICKLNLPNINSSICDINNYLKKTLSFLENCTFLKSFFTILILSILIVFLINSIPNIQYVIYLPFPFIFLFYIFLLIKYKFIVVKFFIIQFIFYSIFSFCLFYFFDDLKLINHRFDFISFFLSFFFTFILFSKKNISSIVYFLIPFIYPLLFLVIAVSTLFTYNLSAYLKYFDNKKPSIFFIVNQYKVASNLLFISFKEFFAGYFILLATTVFFRVNIDISFNNSFKNCLYVALTAIFCFLFSIFSFRKYYYYKIWKFSMIIFTYVSKFNIEIFFKKIGVFLNKLSNNKVSSIEKITKKLAPKVHSAIFLDNIECINIDLKSRFINYVLLISLLFCIIFSTSFILNIDIYKPYYYKIHLSIDNDYCLNIKNKPIVKTKDGNVLILKNNEFISNYCEKRTYSVKYK